MGNDYEVRDIGGKKQLRIDARAWKWGASVAEYPEVMRRVVEILMDVDADTIVISDVYDHIYDEKQTRMLREIAEVARKFDQLGFWSFSAVEKFGEDCSEALGNAGALVVKITHDLWLSDPVAAYLKLLATIKQYTERYKAAPENYKECYKKFLRLLGVIKTLMEATKLISSARSYMVRLHKIPKDRTFYSLVFQPQIKPSFLGSRLITAGDENLTILDQYTVDDAEIIIYKHPDHVEPLYYVYLPEYSLPPDQYFIMEKAKELIAKYAPKRAVLSQNVPARKQFLRLYENTIRDVAKQMDVKLSPKTVSLLARILARHTVGYGVLEILLLDKRITDIYVDAPLGSKPIYLVHSEYGQCQTNIVFSEEEARSLVSKLRAMSGRPFDEAHPVLDYDLPDMYARVAVIGPPLSPDGIAFAFRLHKPTPWTLPQFIDRKMLNPLAAGMLSFFIDAQTTMLIAGSRGAGKTSLMTSLILEIPQNQRILTQEDTLEIPVPEIKRLGFNIQRLKTRSPIGGGSSGELPPEDALRTALRLGDSAIVIGEVRSKEAKVLYEAMRVGAAGNVVMGTIHGDSAYALWDRVVNDLGVPTTSFKATDIVVVNAPIRFSGSLQRHRRTISITEVRKHWKSDPLEEGGFLDLMRYDASKDELQLMEDEIKESDLFSKIMKLRGIGYEEIWAEIKARAFTKKYLVDLKRQHGVPEILEGVYTVPAHNKFLLFKEESIEQFGHVDYDWVLEQWKNWVNESLLKDVLAKREAKNASLGK